MGHYFIDTGRYLIRGSALGKRSQTYKPKRDAAS